MKPSSSSSPTLPPPIPSLLKKQKPLVAHWRPDDDYRVCGNCRTQFNVITRKHHCRRCGEIFCSACTPVRIFLPELGYHRPQRCCSFCAVSTSFGQRFETKLKRIDLQFQSSQANLLTKKWKEVACLCGYVTQAKELFHDRSMYEAEQVKNCLQNLDFTVSKELYRSKKCQFLLVSFNCQSLAKRKFVLKKLWDIGGKKNVLLNEEKKKFLASNQLQKSLLGSNDTVLQVFGIFDGPCLSQTSVERTTGTGETTYAVLEYCDSSLREIIENEKLKVKKKKSKEKIEERQILLIALQIAKCLEQLHVHGLSHGSVNLSHILLSWEGCQNENEDGGNYLNRRVRLTDFSSAMLKADWKKKKKYEDHDVDDVEDVWGANDMWSFGCLLYEFASFEHPFNRTESETEIEIETEKHKIDFSNYPSIKILIDRCLVADPLARLTSSECVKLCENMLWPHLPAVHAVASSFVASKRYQAALACNASAFFRTAEEQLFLSCLLRNVNQKQKFSKNNEKWKDFAFQNENVENRFENKKENAKEKAAAVAIQSLVRRRQSILKMNDFSNLVWSELVDEESGHIYWYNNHTGESSWEKPVNSNQTNFSSEEKFWEFEKNEEKKKMECNEIVLTEDDFFIPRIKGEKWKDDDMFQDVTENIIM
eukprot:g3170.t1